MLITVSFCIILDIRDVDDRLDGDRPVYLPLGLDNKVGMCASFTAVCWHQSPLTTSPRIQHCKPMSPSSNSIMACSQLYKEIKQFEKNMADQKVGY